MTDHIPVLLEQVLLQFKPQVGDTLLDATLGLAGHTASYLKSADKSKVIGFDADSNAIVQAQGRLNDFVGRVIFIHSNFSQLKQVLLVNELEDAGINHILFDLGIGSHQLADEQRGFSFKSTGNLSMKYGVAGELPPAQIEAINVLTKRLGEYPDVQDIIARLSDDELGLVIRHYGEERFSRRIARAIKEANLPTSAQELAQIITDAVPGKYKRGRIHCATRTFQALRLAVNRELESLQTALPQAIEVLSPGGKIAVISFHSLEDRIVKRFMRFEAKTCICDPLQPQCTCSHSPRLSIVTKKPIVPTEDEVAVNPRSRSAKLRVAIKIE